MVRHKPSIRLAHSGVIIATFQPRPTPTLSQGPPPHRAGLRQHQPGRATSDPLRRHVRPGQGTLPRQRRHAERNPETSGGPCFGHLIDRRRRGNIEQSQTHFQNSEEAPPAEMGKRLRLFIARSRNAGAGPDGRPRVPKRIAALCVPFGPGRCRAHPGPRARHRDGLRRRLPDIRAPPRAAGNVEA